MDIRSPGECWPWRERTDRGRYGRFDFKDESGKFTSKPAHRWLLGQLRGKPLIDQPRGLEDGCHTCNNPPCCNPGHLYVDTRSGNVKYSVDSDRHVQSRKEKCQNDHDYDEANTYVTPGGERRCRACRKEQAHKQDQGRKNRRTHCKNRHRLAGANLKICKNGARKCLKCEAARVEAAISGRQRQLAG